MKLKDLVAEIFLAICVIATILGAVHTCCTPISQTTTPVEDIRVDTLKLENDKLVIEINNLDSIKDVKVIEVKSLDNDSTLKLFYELIRK